MFRLLSWWKKVGSRAKAPSRSKAAKRHRPELLLLESRLAPAGMSFDHVYYASDGASLAAAVQTADKQSGSSEIILTKQGTYNLSAPLVLSANITITGQVADSASSYVLQPTSGAKQGVIDVTGAHSVTLNDLTVQGGSTSGDGGGIDVTSAGARLTLEDAVIQNNSAAGSGGGVAVADGASLKIVDTSVENNTAAENGGGIYFNASSQAARVFVSDSTFSDNQATGDSSDGAGIFVGASSPTSTARPPSVGVFVTNTNFFDNSAGDDGGGIWMTNTTHFAGTNIVASGNSAVADAGAIGDSVTNLNGASFTLTNSLVLSNVVTGPGTSTTPDGGGICFDFQSKGSQQATGNVSAVIAGNTIAGNTVSGAGGGMFLRDEATHTAFSAVIANNNISGNQANLASPDPEKDAGEGGGVYLQASGHSNTVTFNGNFVAGNSAAKDGGGLYLRLDSGSASLNDNLFIGNVAGQNGGGIFLTGNTDTGGTGGKAILTHDQIAGNSAAADGGGLYVDQTGVATLFKDVITRNTAGNAGGGIFDNNGSVTVKHSTVVSNKAPTDPNFSGPISHSGNHGGQGGEGDQGDEGD